MTPKKAAIDLIERYVKRGDDLQSLRSGQMGTWSKDYKAQIAGYLNGKRYSIDYILVEEVDGQKCAEVFKLETIFNEIKSGNIQKTLL